MASTDVTPSRTATGGIAEGNVDMNETAEATNRGLDKRDNDGMHVVEDDHDMAVSVCDTHATSAAEKNRGDRYCSIESVVSGVTLPTALHEESHRRAFLELEEALFDHRVDHGYKHTKRSHSTPKSRTDEARPKRPLSISERRILLRELAETLGGGKEASSTSKQPFWDGTEDSSSENSGDEYHKIPLVDGLLEVLDKATDFELLNAFACYCNDQSAFKDRSQLIDTPHQLDDEDLVDSKSAVQDRYSSRHRSMPSTSLASKVPRLRHSSRSGRSSRSTRLIGDAVITSLKKGRHGSVKQSSSCDSTQILEDLEHSLDSRAYSREMNLSVAESNMVDGSVRGGDKFLPLEMTNSMLPHDEEVMCEKQVKTEPYEAETRSCNKSAAGAMIDEARLVPNVSEVQQSCPSEEILLSMDDVSCDHGKKGQNIPAIRRVSSDSSQTSLSRVSSPYDDKRTNPNIDLQGPIMSRDHSVSSERKIFATGKDNVTTLRSGADQDEEQTVAKKVEGHKSTEKKSLDHIIAVSEFCQVVDEEDTAVNCKTSERSPTDSQSLSNRIWSSSRSPEKRLEDIPSKTLFAPVVSSNQEEGTEAIESDLPERNPTDSRSLSNRISSSSRGPENEDIPNETLFGPLVSSNQAEEIEAIEGDLRYLVKDQDGAFEVETTLSPRPVCDVSTKSKQTPCSDNMPTKNVVCQNELEPLPSLSKKKRSKISFFGKKRKNKAGAVPIVSPVPKSKSDSTQRIIVCDNYDAAPQNNWSKREVEQEGERELSPERPNVQTTTTCTDQAPAQSTSTKNEAPNHLVFQESYNAQSSGDVEVTPTMFVPGWDKCIPEDKINDAQTSVETDTTGTIVSFEDYPVVTDDEGDLDVPLTSTGAAGETEINRAKVTKASRPWQRKEGAASNKVASTSYPFGRRNNEGKTSDKELSLTGTGSINKKQVQNDLKTRKIESLKGTNLAKSSYETQMADKNIKDSVEPLSGVEGDRVKRTTPRSPKRVSMISITNDGLVTRTRDADFGPPGSNCTQNVIEPTLHDVCERRISVISFVDKKKNNRASLKGRKQIVGNATAEEIFV